MLRHLLSSPVAMLSAQRMDFMSNYFFLNELSFSWGVWLETGGQKLALTERCAAWRVSHSDGLCYYKVPGTR